MPTCAIEADVFVGGVNVTKLFDKMGGPEIAKRFLAGELVLVEVASESVTKSLEPTTGDNNGDTRGGA